MYLLLIDLLGVKARWAIGRAEAEVALQAFDQFVLSGLADAQVVPDDGGIDSDAAALVFEQLDDALRAARGIYLTAFRTGAPLVDDRDCCRFG